MCVVAMIVTMVVSMVVSMIVRMRMVTVLMLFRMHFGMRGSFILKPELRDRISNYSSQRTQFLKRIANSILHVCR